MEILTSFVVEARQGIQTIIVPTAIINGNTPTKGFNFMYSKPSNEATSPKTERALNSTAVISSLYITSINTDRDPGFPDIPYDLFIEDYSPGKTMYSNYILSDIKAYASSSLSIDKPITLSPYQMLKIYVPTLVNNPSLGDSNPNPNGKYSNAVLNVTCGAVLITTE